MLILLLLLYQDPAVMEPESINATVYLKSGDKLDLSDVSVKGIEPHSFQIYSEGETTFVNLFRVSRITRLEKPSMYEILFDSGEIQIGRVMTVSFTGKNVNKEDAPNVAKDESLSDHQKLSLIHLRDMERIHFISGNQLRACLQGHYEKYTPYPFCPVCGTELIIGPYPDSFPEQTPTLPAYHRLRLDPRNPTSGRNQ